MTPPAPEPNPFAQARRRLWVGRAVALVVLAIAAILLWQAAHQHAVKLRKEEPVSVLMAVAPPPPPPPPPPKPIPKEVMKEPTPVPQPIPRPVEAPQPVAKAEAITENAPAQEGSDDFQIGAGSGTGMLGSGGRGGPAGAFNRAAYASYLAQIIQRAVQTDAALRNHTFRVNVRVWLSAAGKVTRAELRASTGSEESDRQLHNLLESLPAPEQPPPPSVLEDLPVQMSIESKRTL
jgi:outer membrane biosynthesis protein TonB